MDTDNNLIVLNTPKIRKGKQYYVKPQNGCFARRRFSTQSQEKEKLLRTFQADTIKCCQRGCLLFRKNDIVCNEAVQKNLLLQGGILVVTSMQKYMYCAMQICMLYHANMYALLCHAKA